MKKKILILVAMAVFFVAGTNKSLALFPVDPIILKKPNLKLDPALLEQWHKTKCEKIQNKIGEKNGNIQEKREKHMNAYDNLKSRLETLVSRLDQNGYDTAQLKTDLETLKNKIDKFKDDSKTLDDKIEATRDKTCDDDDNTIKANLSEIRTLIQTVRKDSQGIRQFYKNKIRSDVKAIKKQKTQ